MKITIIAYILLLLEVISELLGVVEGVGPMKHLAAECFRSVFCVWVL